MTMVKMARNLGWSGIHFFYFGRPFLGICHLLLSLIGVLGIMSLYLIFILFGNAQYFHVLLITALTMILALPISIIAGILLSIYWSYKTDEDFNAAYHLEKTQDEVSENTEATD